jgi:hypothetical protein
MFQRCLLALHQQFQGKIAAATTRSVFIASKNAVNYFHRYEFEDDSFFTLKWNYSDKLEFKPGDVVKFSFTQQEFQGRPQRDIVANSMELIDNGDARRIQSMKTESAHTRLLSQQQEPEEKMATTMNSSTSTTSTHPQASNKEQLKNTNSIFQRYLPGHHQQFHGKIAAATTRSVFIASQNAVKYFHRYEFEDDSFFTLKWKNSDKLDFKSGDVVKFSFTQEEFQGRPQRDIVANSMELIEDGDVRRVQSMKAEAAHMEKLRLLSLQHETEEKMATTINSSTSTTPAHPQASNKEQLKNTKTISCLPGHHQQFQGKIAAATTRSVFIASKNAVKYFHRYEFEDDSFFTLKWQNSDKLEFKPGDVVKFSFTQQEFQGRPQRDIVANSLELIEQGDAQLVQSMKPEATHMEKLKQPSQQQKTEETLLNSSTSTTPANSQASNEEQGVEQSEDPTQLAVEQKIRMEAVAHMVEILKSQSFTPQATRTAAQFVREVIQYASLLEGYIQTGELEQSINSETVQLPETTTEQSIILDSEVNKNVPTPTPTQEIVVQPSASGVQVQLEVTQKATI